MKIRQLLTEYSKDSDEYVNDELISPEQDQELQRARLRLYFKRQPNMEPIVNKLKQQPNFEYVGSGAAAYVHKIDNPHELDRVHRTSPNYDGTLAYLRYIANNQDKCYNNPFFPRILVAPSKIDKKHSTVQLEHLLPFHTNKIIKNDEFLSSVWEQYFTFQRMPHQTFTHIVELIQHGLLERRTDFVQSAPLKKAMTIIYEIREKTPHCFIDLHEHNVMWRMTGLMPQLVLTDPLFISKSAV